MLSFQCRPGVSKYTSSTIDYEYATVPGLVGLTHLAVGLICFDMRLNISNVFDPVRMTAPSVTTVAFRGISAQLNIAMVCNMLCCIHLTITVLSSFALVGFHSSIPCRLFRKKPWVCCGDTIPLLLLGNANIGSTRNIWHLKTHPSIN